jgi:serine/threonine-protein kinase mTOR
VRQLQARAALLRSLLPLRRRSLTDEPANGHAPGGQDKPRPLAPVHPFVERITSHLLTLAASDVDGGVRRATIECLLSAFDARKQYSLRQFFTHADAVAALTLCLNDVVPAVRLAALTIMGRIARLNPAAATPVLRRYLEQLLTDIEHCPDARRLEDSTMLLTEMIHQARFVG